MVIEAQGNCPLQGASHKGCQIDAHDNFPGKPQVKDTTNKLDSDLFVQSVQNKITQNSVFQIFLFVDDVVDSACHLVDSTVRKIFGQFSSCVDFFKTNLENLTNLDKEKALNKMKNTLSQIGAAAGNDKDFKIQSVVNRLQKTISEIDTKEEIENLDLANLIKKWKETKEGKILLEMAEMVENDECIEFSNDDLKEAFVKGLKSFGKALDEVMKNPPSQKRDCVKEELEKGACCLVDGLEPLTNKGSDKELTKTEKKYIGEKLKSATEHAENITKDKLFPGSSKYVGCALHDLRHWISFTTEFLKHWPVCEKEKAKLCEKRTDMKRRFRKSCNKHLYLKKLAEKACARMYEARVKADFYIMVFNKLKQMSNTSGGLYVEIKNEMEKYIAVYNSARNEYRSCISASQQAKKIAQEIVSSLPPSYICSPTGLNLELDLVC